MISLRMALMLAQLRWCFKVLTNDMNRMICLDYVRKLYCRLIIFLWLMEVDVHISVVPRFYTYEIAWSVVRRWILELFNLSKDNCYNNNNFGLYFLYNIFIVLWFCWDLFPFYIFHPILWLRLLAFLIFVIANTNLLRSFHTAKI